MSDVALPKALTDFVFDLHDSVTLSQITEEQTKLYQTAFRDEPYPAVHLGHGRNGADRILWGLTYRFVQRFLDITGKFPSRCSPTISFRGSI